jgi:nicotinate dehydrogenase subunit A
MTTRSISLRVNEKRTAVRCEGSTPLLYVLRNDLGLNGPKFGCGLGQCGACTVLVDGQAMRSCVTPVGFAGNKAVSTLDGLSRGNVPHPLQRAFIELQAAQCGYCTNGMIMAAQALLDRNKAPSEAEIKQALAGNLCRCGSHNRIVRAVRQASEKS